MKFPRVVWVLLDGLPHELVRAYANVRPDSRMADLRRLQRTRALRPLAPNCQTPPSLFTIWSGRGPAEHGLLGYDVPAEFSDGRARHVDAFECWPRDIPMVWDRYAANGQTVRTCAVPFVQPERLGPSLLSATHVFGAPEAAPAVLGAGESLGLRSGRRLHVDACGAELALHADGERLWAVPAEGTLPRESAAVPMAAGRETHRRMLVRASRIDGALRMICLGYHAIAVTGVDAASRRQAGEGRPFVAGNPGKLYKNGALGRRADQGGEGAAERLLGCLMRDVHASFAADALWAVDQDDADLVVAYNPVIDLLGHQVLRQALDDGALACARPEGALLLEALDLLDGFIQQLQQRMAPETCLVLHSDHGMCPTGWDLFPNGSFEQRGLLARGRGGAIDPAGSAIFYHPAENGLVAIHPERLRSRGLALDDVLAPLDEALRGFGLGAVEVLPGIASPIGAPWLGDRYLHVPAGVRACADLDRPLLERALKGGDHTMASDHPWLEGVLMWCGPDLFGTAPAQLELDALMPTILQCQGPGRVKQ